MVGLEVTKATYCLILRSGTAGMIVGINHESLENRKKEKKKKNFTAPSLSKCVETQAMVPVDRIRLWVYPDRVPVHPMFYLLKGTI